MGIQNRYAVTRSSSHLGSKSIQSKPTTPKATSLKPEPIDVVSPKTLDIGSIGDAEVNSALYKVHLLKAENVIKSISHRNEILEQELASMHALLRCVYIIDLKRAQNITGSVELLRAPNVSTSTTSPPRSPMAPDSATIPKRRSILKSATKMLKKNKHQAKDRDMDADTSPELYGVSETSLTSHVDDTPTPALSAPASFTSGLK